MTQMDNPHFQDFKNFHERLQEDLPGFAKEIEHYGIHNDSPGHPGIFYKLFLKACDSPSTEEDKDILWHYARSLVASLFTDHEAVHASETLLNYLIEQASIYNHSFKERLEKDKKNIDIHKKIQALGRAFEEKNILETKKIAETLLDDDLDKDHQKTIKNIIDQINLIEMDDKKKKKITFITIGIFMSIVLSMIGYTLIFGKSKMPPKTQQQTQIQQPISKKSTPPEIGFSGIATLENIRWCMTEYKFIETIAPLLKAENKNNEDIRKKLENRLTQQTQRCQNIKVQTQDKLIIEEELKNYSFEQDTRNLLNQ